MSKVIHERESLRHRILLVGESANAIGAWTSNDKLAELNGWFANNGASSQLPFGVFKISPVESQVLA